jgi:hypothetical protein
MSAPDSVRVLRDYLVFREGLAIVLATQPDTRPWHKLLDHRQLPQPNSCPIG